MRTAALASTLVLGSVSLIGCGGGDDDEASSFCQVRVQLGQSIASLRDLSVRDDGIDQVDAQLATVLTDVETLQSSASDLRPEVDAVRASVDGLRTSVETASSLGDQATALVAGLDELATTWNSLDEAAGSECD